jgi:hypothetical protein
MPPKFRITQDSLCLRCNVNTRHIDPSGRIRSCCLKCTNVESVESYNRNKDFRIERLKRNYKKFRKDKILQSLKSRMKFKYGLSIEEYNSMLESQNHKCMICKTPTENLKRKLAVDHCHTTNSVRGLLCGTCNTGLGQLKDSPELLRKAAEYIEFYKNRNNQQ